MSAIRLSWRPYPEPGSWILEIGPWGVREADWAELELVAHWRRYLQEPMRYLRHVIDTD
jgi:hypothetical protein